MTKNENTYIVGVIAEYNPFHNGHAYHIKKAKEASGADYCVVVMSGDFVQRGAPAIYNKYARTAMALSAGADLVIELPSVYATGSAEHFAFGAVSLLTRLGAVDSLCFGSECGDVRKLSRLASILMCETEDYQQQIKTYLSQGLSYPAARQNALSRLGLLTDQETHLLSSPNNILGIEYCKALIGLNSPIQPLTITRQGNGYHDLSLTQPLSSASAIRQALKNALDSHLSQLVPETVLPILETLNPLWPDDFSLLLNGALLRLQRKGTGFDRFADVSGEISARILRQIFDFSTWEERCASLKSRQYTYTRISRCLLHILLGITDDKMNRFKKEGGTFYGRVLGFRRSSAAVITRIKKESQIPLVTKPAGAARQLEGTALEMFQDDLFASHLYRCVYADKYGTKKGNEYNQPLIIS